MTAAASSLATSDLRDVDPARNPTPSLGAVAREQFTALGLALRPEMLALAGLMAVVGTLAVIAAGTDGKADFDLLDFVFPAFVLGLVAPLGVWKGEGPSRRSYLWSMPVPRPAQTLIRVGTGWLWVMLVVAVYLAWGMSVPLLTGGHIVLSDAWELALLEGAPAGTLIRDLGWHGHAWMWLLPFAGATVAYGAGSILPIASDHPWRWVAGLIMASFIVAAVREVGGDAGGGFDEAVWKLFYGEYGFMKLVTGSDLELLPPPDAGGVKGAMWSSTPDPRGWLTAVALWGAAPVVAVIGLAFRHQER
jgi:hypothetical protein